jgi:aryl-alcohol dehydrogenase-like predicted oxidoreductase
LPGEGSLAAPLKVVADLQRQGLVRHIGLSNVTRTQFKEARAIAEIVCVQNQYNLGHRGDEASLTLPQDAVTKLDGIGR